MALSWLSWREGKSAMEFHLEEFKKTRDMLRDIINPTPVQYSRTFGQLAGCSIYLKPECLQKNGSFKIRGAYNTLNSLSSEAKSRGVVTCSAGNWAQGVAYGCRLLGIKALVVMPEKVARTKLEATKGYGADVLLYGSTSTELFQKAQELSEEKHLTYLSAFDEPAMIIGHGSIGLEILDEVPDIDVIVVPVGGGALVSSIALTARKINPNIKVFGVQPVGAAAMHASLKKGEIVELDTVETIAEGLALKRSGERTFQIIREWVEEIVLVADDEIKAAVLLLLERAKLLVEPSGAAPLAAIINSKIPNIAPDTKVAAVLSGGNIDLPVLKQYLPEAMREHQ
jgi:threonine dehydratase